VKPHIIDEIENFYMKNFHGHPMLGIHMRGTDKGTANASPHLMRIVPPKDYFPYIDKYIAKHSSCKIFVATDQQQYLEEMKNRYKQRIISYDVIRSKSCVNAFQKDDENRYIKGKEVLIDCLLLSKCDFLLKCTSAVGEYAIYFNTKLGSIDLNQAQKKLGFLEKIEIKYNFLRGKYLAHGLKHVLQYELVHVLPSMFQSIYRKVVQ
jgi:hypothetical protein